MEEYKNFICFYASHCICTYWRSDPKHKGNRIKERKVQMKKKYLSALKAAFPHTIPIFAGFWG